MKAINNTKIALILFAFLFALNLNATNTSNDLLKPTIEQFNEAPGEHQFCISILIITYCYTWETEDPKGLKAKKISAMLIANNGDDFTIEGKEGKSYLIIKGFDNKLNGIVIKGKENSFCEGMVTKPGKYTIKNGELTIPIIEKNKKLAGKELKKQALRMN
ncbi:hypothetical protein [Lacinutrix chionoecetis]